MYYPMPTQEVIEKVKLKLTQSAAYLLDLVKSHAPYGKPVFFSKNFNPRTLQAELGMHRTTFARARKLLVDRGLVEFSSYYIRDCHTIDRTQFKKNDPATEFPFQQLQIFDQPSHAFQSAGLHSKEQPGTERSPEPIQDSAFKLLQNKLQNHEKEKTTTHSVVVPSPKAKQPQIPKAERQKPQNVKSTPVLAAKTENKDSEQKASSGRDISAAPFLRFQENLKALGVRMNHNLLKAFHAAGVERVERAIAYLKEKIATAAPGAITSVGGYLVNALRNFEVWGLETVGVVQHERDRFNQWFNKAHARNFVFASTQENGKMYVFLPDRSRLSWEEALVRFPCTDL